MSEDAPADGPDRAIDAAALMHIRRRWADAAQPPWLHAEVARRMAERLPLIKLQPTRVLDWGSRSGASEDLLARAYPRAVHWRVPDPGGGAVQATVAPWWSARRWLDAEHSASSEPSLTPGCAELLWSNMALHVVDQPLAQFQRWHELVAVDGFVMFSTLGPGSLGGLRALYSRLGWGRAHADFVDMHDLGDMLAQSGFADPVMDQEIVTLTWPDAASLLSELRALGGNADPRRVAGLRTPRWRERLLRELGSLAHADGRPRLDFEVVYGHAFKAPAPVRVTERTVLPLEDMRAMVRARRGGPARGGG